MRVLAVDPGKRKCGLAVSDSEKGTLRLAVVPRADLRAVCAQWLQELDCTHVIVGGSTGSAAAVEEVRSLSALPLQVVDERHTTERARPRYYQDHPPRGWQRLIPRGLLVPPVPVDDYAALVMAEDFLHTKALEK